MVRDSFFFFNLFNKQGKRLKSKIKAKAEYVPKIHVSLISNGCISMALIKKFGKFQNKAKSLFLP